MIEDLIENMITELDALTNIIIALANSDYLSQEEKASSITQVMTYYREKQCEKLNSMLSELSKNKKR